MDHLKKAKKMRRIQRFFDFAADAVQHDIARKKMEDPNCNLYDERKHRNGYQYVSHWAQKAKERHLEAQALKTGENLPLQKSRYREMKKLARMHELILGSEIEDMRHHYTGESDYHKEVMKRARANLKWEDDLENSPRRNMRFR